MRSTLGIFSFVLAALVFTGCTPDSPARLSLKAPKGWPAPHKIALGSWEDQLKQKLNLGDAAVKESTRIPFLAAADRPVQIPMLAAADAPKSIAPVVAKVVPRPLPAKPARLARTVAKNRAISCKNCRAHKPHRHASQLARR